MHEDLEIEGHFVHVEAVEQRNGSWTWWYAIDAEGVTENRDRALPNPDLALAEAKEHATGRIKARKA
jgi:hypothetical protein